MILNANNQPTLPYPGFGLLEYSQNNANSSYQGLDLTLERRFTSGLSFRLAYTWSKSIDDSAEQLSVYGSNAFSQINNNLTGWRGPSDFDVPQRVVFSWVYELPFGKGKPFLSTALLPRSPADSRSPEPSPTPRAVRSPRSIPPTAAPSISAKSRRCPT